MRTMLRGSAGALMMGAFLFTGGTPQVLAAPVSCPTSAVSISSLGITAATPFVCDQPSLANDIKTWTLTATSLPGNATVDWTEVGPEHTVTVNSNSTFTQGATYTLDYNVVIGSNAPSGSIFAQVTGGLLLGAAGGTATLDKTFTAADAIAPIHVTTATPGASENVPVPHTPNPVTSITTHDSLFVGNSNLLGFANTYEETRLIPEPATLLVVGSGLLGLALVRRRRR